MQGGKNAVGAGDVNPSISDALAGWSAFAEMLRSGLGAGAAGSRDGTKTSGPDGGPASGFSRDRGLLLGFMSQACLVFAISGLRYWTRAAQIYAEHSPALYRLMTASSSSNLGDPEEQRILLDRLRALLRELAELPGEESRWMQVELEKLEGQALWGAGGQAGDFRGRKKMKM